MMVWNDKNRIWSAREEMQSRIKEEKFHNFETLWYFINILSYNDQIKVIIKSFWRERDRSTFGMKISKSSSVVYLVKKSKYWSTTLLSKAKIELWPVDGSLVISWSTELQIGWFLMHWKTNSKDYNFYVLHKS